MNPIGEQLRLALAGIVRVAKALEVVEGDMNQFMRQRLLILIVRINWIDEYIIVLTIVIAESFHTAAERQI